jgi:hypothetical protein
MYGNNISDRNVTIYYYLGTIRLAIWAGSQYSFTSIPPNDEWHMITFSYHNNSFKVWYDGTLELNVSKTFNWIDDYVTIGNSYPEPTNERSWRGYIDEVAIWKKELTDDDVTQLYNNGNGLSYDNF